LDELSQQKLKINKAYLVLCTNSRASDLAAATKIWRAAEGVKFYVCMLQRRLLLSRKSQKMLATGKSRAGPPLIIIREFKRRVEAKDNMAFWKMNWEPLVEISRMLSIYSDFRTNSEIRASLSQESQKFVQRFEHSIFFEGGQEGLIYALDRVLGQYFPLKPPKGEEIGNLRPCSHLFRAA
jgi:hypothetical protein